MDSDLLQKVDLILGSNCQSAIHKFTSSHRVVSFDSKLSCPVRELINIKSTYARALSTIKIAAYQDDAKKSYELSFLERLNILCDIEAKQLIRDMMNLNRTTSLPFQFHSPLVSNKLHKSLVSTEMIR